MKFFGRHGLQTTYVANSTFRNLEFFTTAIGIEGLGSTNINVVASQFWNQAAYGVRLRAVDAEAGQSGRKGGELWRLTACDWAGCSTGVRATQNGAFTMIACMQDYCGLPTLLEGCHGVFIAQSYLGAARVYRGLTNVPGYVAPKVDEVALLCTPWYDTRGSFGFNGHFVNNQFVGYGAPETALPVVWFDRTGISNLPIQWVLFSNNSIYRNGMNASPDLVRFDGVAGLSIANNYFQAINTNLGKVEPYRILDGTPRDRITAYGSLIYDIKNGARSQWEGYISGGLPALQTGQFQEFMSGAGDRVGIIGVLSNNITVVRFPAVSGQFSVRNQAGVPKMTVHDNSTQFNIFGTTYELVVGDNLGGGFFGCKLKAV